MRSSRFATALLFVFSGLFAGPVWAAAIANLDKQDAHVEMQTNEGFTPIMIPAGETWRMPGRVYMRYHGHTFWINEDEEFAIWNQNDFGPQRRLNFMGSNRN